MNKLGTCSDCGSFLPHGAGVCPVCRRSNVARRLPGPVRALLAVGGGGLLSVTLSACYGAPCAGYACEHPYCDDEAQDLDGDGYCREYDCDETSASVHYFAGCMSDGGSDAGATDAGATDAGATDGGASDGGATDAGATDGGAAADAAAADSGA